MSVVLPLTEQFKGEVLRCWRGLERKNNERRKKTEGYKVKGEDEGLLEENKERDNDYQEELHDLLLFFFWISCGRIKQKTDCILCKLCILCNE